MAKARSCSEVCISSQHLSCMGRCRSPSYSLQTNSVMHLDPLCLLLARNSCENTPDMKKGRETATAGAWPAQLAWWCVWSSWSLSRDRMVGEAAGSTTCFPSPPHDNSQVMVKGGARLGTKTVGCTHENYCSTEQLETTDAYLWGKHGCFHSAFMLPHCLQGRATPSEDKPLSSWARRAVPRFKRLWPACVLHHTFPANVCCHNGSNGTPFCQWSTEKPLGVMCAWVNFAD